MPLPSSLPDFDQVVAAAQDTVLILGILALGAAVMVVSFTIYGVHKLRKIL